MIYLSEYTLYWLLPILFIIHRFEEMILLPGFVKKNFEYLVHKSPQKLIKRIRNITLIPSSRYLLAVLIEFITLCTITLYAVEFRKFNLFAVINIYLFLHVFIHIGIDYYIRKISPGIFTGILIFIPYEVRLLLNIFSKGELQWGKVLLYGILFLIIYLPFLNTLYIYGPKKRK